MIILEYFIMFIGSLFSNYSQKRYSNNANDVFSLCTYTSLTGLLAMGVFLVMAGFRINVNLRTSLYALVYGLVIILNHAVSLLILHFGGMSELSIIRTAGTMVMSFFTGFLIFSESITVIAVLRACIMVAASLCVFFGGKKSETKCCISPVGIVLIGVSVLVGVALSIIQKNFAIDNKVTDSNSYFFLTNVFIFIVSVSIILVMSKGKIKRCTNELKRFPNRSIQLILLNTICGNINSVLTISILTKMDVSFNAVISSAVGILATSCAAKVFFREKQPWLPILLSLIAVGLAAFQ